MELPVLNYEGNTYIPLRNVSEATGAKVNWDGEKREVEITTVENNDEIKLLAFKRLKASTLSMDKYKKLSDIGHGINQFRERLGAAYSEMETFDSSKEIAEINNTIELYNNSLLTLKQDVDATISEIKQYGFNGKDMYDAIEKYQKSLALYQSSTNSLNDYYKYKLTSDFEKYLGESAKAYDKTLESIIEINTRYNVDFTIAKYISYQ